MTEFTPEQNAAFIQGGRGYNDVNTPEAVAKLNDAYRSSMGKVFGGETPAGRISGITPEMAEKSVSQLIAAGHDPTEVRAAFAEYTGRKPVDPNKAEREAFDKSSLAATFNPDQYQYNDFGWKEFVEPGTDPAETYQAVRSGFAAMGLPAAMGSLGEMMAEAAARFAKLPEGERTIERMSVRHKLENILGQEATAQAKQTLDLWRAKHPELVEKLIAADFFSDPRILGQLALAARNKAIRSKL